MNARDLESAVLVRCAHVASGAGLDVRDAQEANVFRLAGMVLGSVRPAEAARLRRASEQFFTDTASVPLPPDEVVRQGWAPGLPRLRDMLCARLLQP